MMRTMNKMHGVIADRCGEQGRSDRGWSKKASLEDVAYIFIDHILCARACRLSGNKDEDSIVLGA